MARQAPKRRGNRSIRIQVVLEKETVERLDRLAERLGMTRSYFAALLLESGLEREGWIIKFVTKKFVMNMMSALGIQNNTRAKKKRDEYAQALRDANEDEA